MTSADELQPATVAREMGSADLLARYITLTAQLRESTNHHLERIRTERAAVRDEIIERLGLDVGMAFINDVERVRRG